MTLGFCLPAGFSPTRYFNFSMGISHAASYLRIVLSMRLLATMYPPRSLGQSPLTSELAPACPLGVPPPSIRRSQPGGHSPLMSISTKGVLWAVRPLFIYAWVSSQPTTPVRPSPKPRRHAISSTGAPLPFRCDAIWLNNCLSLGNPSKVCSMLPTDCYLLRLTTHQDTV